MQRYCFAHLNLLFGGVFVAVAIVVCLSSLLHVPRNVSCDIWALHVDDCVFCSGHVTSKYSCDFKAQ